MDESSRPARSRESEPALRRRAGEAGRPAATAVRRPRGATGRRRTAADVRRRGVGSRDADSLLAGIAVSLRHSRRSDRRDAQPSSASGSPPPKAGPAGLAERHRGRRDAKTIVARRRRTCRRGASGHAVVPAAGELRGRLPEPASRRPRPAAAHARGRTGVDASSPRRPTITSLPPCVERLFFSPALVPTIVAATPSQPPSP